METQKLFKHDFVVVREGRPIPWASDFHTNNFKGWTVHSRPLLPVSPIFDRNRRHLGFILGFWALNEDHQDLSPAELCVDLESAALSIDEINSNLMESLLGRFAMILGDDVFVRWYPDASGSLSAVYSSDDLVVASRPNLISIDESDAGLAEAIIAIRTHSGTWYPAGLCASNIRVVLPNHCLDFLSGRLHRTWPAPYEQFESLPNDIAKNIETIRNNIVTYIQAVGRRHPITMNLTSGRDSRMLLACCKDLINSIVFHTLPRHYGGDDSAMAMTLAKHFGLRHVTAENFPPDRALLQGVGGEVGRCFYWVREDLGRDRGSVEMLESRLDWGQITHPAIAQSLRDWFTGLPSSDWRTVLDLAYIELRLACAMGPAMYNHDVQSEFAAYPMNGRKIYSAMLRLPWKWRYDQMLYVELLKKRWPDLLLFPLHKAHWTGFGRYNSLLKYVRHSGKWKATQKIDYLKMATINRSPLRMVLDDVKSLVSRSKQTTSSRAEMPI